MGKAPIIKFIPAIFWCCFARNHANRRKKGVNFLCKETLMKNREKLLDEIFEAALQNDMIYRG
jgi:hypothetical protein